MSIREWPASERPRERLLALGPGPLSDAELLAIVFGHGHRGRSAIDLARDLLTTHGGLRSLFTAAPGELCKARGLGPAKSARLAAVVELARRQLNESAARGDALTSPGHTRAFLRAHLRDRRREVFTCVFLDNRHRIVACEDLFHGTIDGASVHPRIVVERALHHNAAALIAAHNHPSGVAEPSAADLAITRRLKEALALVEIRLLDHLIIGDAEPVSLAERGAV